MTPTTEHVGVLPPQGGRRAAWTRNPWLWAAVIGVVTVTALRPVMVHEPEPPPVISELPQYTLVDEDGRAFGSRDLQGHVYVANFFFGSCRTVCPPLLRATAELQRRLAEARLDVRIVSFTVDPEHDDPVRLREIAQEYGADPAIWTFLTGPETEIRHLVQDGFRAGIGERQEGSDDLIEIAHSTKLVLVDGKGGIRDYYGTDDLEIDRLMHQAAQVHRRERQP